MATNETPATRQGVCEHGHLARKCEVCERDAETQRLLARVWELEEAMRSIRDQHQKDHEAPLCVMCGASGGRWPCVTNLDATAALNAAREGK